MCHSARVGHLLPLFGIGGTAPELMIRSASGHCSDANICQLWSLERAKVVMRVETDAEAGSTQAGIRLKFRGGSTSEAQKTHLRFDINTIKGGCLPRRGAFIRQVAVCTSSPGGQSAWRPSHT